MSFFNLNMVTSPSSFFNEQQWIDQIRQTLNEPLDSDTTEIPVTIFSVPKTLKSINLDSYTPQQVAIGPYHHLRPELYDMERYKVAAVKRAHKEYPSFDLEGFVEHLIGLELRIRASYHRPLNFGSEALAWIMAIDASFLYEFFQVCGVKRAGRVLTKTMSKLSLLIHLSGNKTAKNAILRDIVMLENQIPMFVMRLMMEGYLSSVEDADDVMGDMLVRLCRELCPFKTMVVGCGERMGRCVGDCVHFLDFLYHFVVLESEAYSQVVDSYEDEEENEEKEKEKEEKPLGFLDRCCCRCWSIISILFEKIFSNPIKLIIKIPFFIISKIPILKAFKGLIDKMINTFVDDDDDKKKKKKDGDEDEWSSSHGHPLLEEIAIPSVTDLVKVGVQFIPVNGGITSVDFDKKTLKFSIPKIDLDVNSEVVLRNLVAYEACTVSGPLLLTRYTELMNGIIDTEMDVKILCQKGIMINHLKSEKEVAELWNGMTKSIRLTKVPSLDKLIADVNEYYNGKWRVKMGNFLRDYVFGSWKILTVLAALIVLLMMGLQSFCQVYSCHKFIQGWDL